MHNSFSHDDPELLWVNADAPDVGCTGTFESPFSSVENALDRVCPGQTIVLTSGDYVGNTNIQKSGSPRNPIRICAERPGEVTVTNACWFFYDTSDLIVSGISFKDASSGALSLIGTCNRNRFEHLRFINCGTREESGCTLYMGGAGGGCNIVEECSFEQNASAPESENDTIATVAIMISMGDAEHDNPIVNNVIRRNTISGFSYGIIAGGDESHTVRCGHIIEYNRITDCSLAGITVKCGDTTVRGNVLSTCKATGLSVCSELDCTITDNRISDSDTGITLEGKGHTIAGNCLLHCATTGLHVKNSVNAHPGPAENCFIERNSLIHSPETGSAAAAIVLDAGTSGILQQNLITGHQKPYAIAAFRHPASDTVPDTNFIIRDNGITEGNDAIEGTLVVTPAFIDSAGDNFTTDGSYGAGGWSVRPEGFDPKLDGRPEDDTYRDSTLFEDEEGTMKIPGEDDTQNPLEKYFSPESTDDEPDEKDEMSYWYPDADE